LYPAQAWPTPSTTIDVLAFTLKATYSAADGFAHDSRAGELDWVEESM